MAKIELPAEVGASALARLIGVTSAAFHDLARRGVVVVGSGAVPPAMILPLKTTRPGC
jgi:hypothetical protein